MILNLLIGASSSFSNSELLKWCKYPIVLDLLIGNRKVLLVQYQLNCVLEDDAFPQKGLSSELDTEFGSELEYSVELVSSEIDF